MELGGIYIKELRNKDDVNALFDRLFPICRSITGGGLRSSLSILSEYIPFEIISFATGEKVLNWEIPEEWSISEGWIRSLSGDTIIDFKNNNLHVINYSAPVDFRNTPISANELKKHIHTIKELPGAIPYVTSYYERKWGFCMSQKQFDSLNGKEYNIFIDSRYTAGRLDLGHTLLKGDTEKEILLTSYLCHPSMANNELGGPLALAMLYQKIMKWKKRNFSYRFLVNPETIGAIAYLSRFGNELAKKMHSGIVLTCLGGDMPLTYKASRQKTAPIDKVISHLDKYHEKINILDFSPLNGSDERQYCSPGFNFPVGQISRLTYGNYPEYHTSLDTKELMGIENIIDSADKIERILMALDMDGYYYNNYPYGEIRLGDYDLYPKTNSYNTRNNSTNRIQDERTMLNNILMILSYSDGHNSLTDIADMLEISVFDLQRTVEMMKEKGLIDGAYYEEGGRK